MLRQAAQNKCRASSIKNHRRSKHCFIMALVLMMVASLFFSPAQAAYAKAPESGSDPYANRNNRRPGTSNDWSKEAIGGDIYPTFNLLDGNTYFPSLMYLIYGNLIEPATGFNIGLSNQMLTYQEEQSGWTLEFDNQYFHSIFETISNICTRIIQPIAVGFLGLSLVISFLEFSKEVATSKQDHYTHVGSYMMIAVKYSLIMVLINHSLLICQGIYALFLNLIKGALNVMVQGAGAPGAELNEFLVNMQQETYEEFGNTILFWLLSLVLWGAIILMMVQVFGTVLVRMAEIYIMSAFAGFPLVMLCTEKMRNDGLTYFKTFASICLQALIVILVIGFSGPLIGAATKIFGELPVSISAFGSFIAIFASVFAVIGLVKESKNISNKILGGAA